jgi:hypothetical protein
VQYVYLQAGANKSQTSVSSRGANFWGFSTSILFLATFLALRI